MDHNFISRVLFDWLSATSRGALISVTDSPKRNLKGSKVLDLWINNSIEFNQ